MLERMLATHRPARTSVPWILFGATALALTGLVMQWSVTTVQEHDPHDRVVRQGTFLVVAVLAGLVVHRVGYRRVLGAVRPLLVVTWALLILAFVMRPIGGAHRWVMLGPVRFQPSELAKLSMILYLADFAASRGERIRSFREGFLPSFLVLGVTAVLVLLEPDLGQALFILALGSVVLLVGGLRIIHFVKMLGLVAPAALALMASRFDYVKARLDTFFSGFDPSTQVGQGILALAAGGATGRGLGCGRGQLGFVPEMHNDFILTAVGEQAGFLGCAAVIGLFLLLFWHGLRVAFSCEDRASASLAFGITFMIALQAAVNVAVITDTVPPKGISLPFISLGGSSLLVLGVSLALLVSVADGAPAPSRAPSNGSTPECSGSGPHTPTIPGTARNRLDTLDSRPSRPARSAPRFSPHEDGPPDPTTAESRP